MLSKRLLKIAELIEKDKVVFDVGSDHALLPCFLVQQGICPKAYASDVAIGPLNHAKETIARYHLNDKVIPILGDGIENIKDDVDIITISGMGYFTVEHILENKDLSRYDYILVQINKDTDLLREFINKYHYNIIDEVFVKDDFYYEIILFNTKEYKKYNDLEIKYGPINLKKMDDIFVNYLSDRKNKLIEINENAKRKDIDDEINILDSLL